jgi:hypothetical protein
MSFEHIVSQGVTIENRRVAKAITVTGGNKVSINEAIATGTNTAMAIAIDVSQVKAFFLCSDVDMTVKTNSSGSPDNTITLRAGQPYQWYKPASGSPYDSFKLTTDVTILYLTCAADAVFELEYLSDPTP